MTLTPQERALREQLLRIAEQVSSSPDAMTKPHIRRRHAAKRLAVMATMNESFGHHVDLLREHVARPRDITLSKITPHLREVAGGTDDAHVFNAASLLWSVPVSKGFGRRMRYLVRDQHNGKLIGIIGLADPVFNLKPRDAWIGWNARERADRLIHAMDAFVLGSLPPYSKLLGGKLVALLATSSDVVRHFRRKPPIPLQNWLRVLVGASNSLQNWPITWQESSNSPSKLACRSRHSLQFPFKTGLVEPTDPPIPLQNWRQRRR